MNAYLFTESHFQEQRFSGTVRYGPESSSFGGSIRAQHHFGDNKKLAQRITVQLSLL